MKIKVHTDIYLDVENEDQGEEASNLIERGLEVQMRGFPEGEILGVNVTSFEAVTDEELREQGLTEW